MLELADQYPGYSRIYLSMGLEKDDLEEELFWYYKAVEATPNLSETFALIGQAYRKKDKELAQEFIDKSLSLSPNNGLALRILSNLQDKLGNKEEALLLLKKSHLYNPHDRSTLKKLVRIYEETAQYELAIEHCKLFLKLNHNSAEVRDILANSYKKLGQRDLAISTFEDNLERHPNYYWSLKFYGVLLAEENRSEEAILMLERAFLQKSENHGTLCLKISELYQQIDMIQEAVEWTQKAI